MSSFFYLKSVSPAPSNAASSVDQYADYPETEGEGGARGWINSERFLAVK